MVYIATGNKPSDIDLRSDISLKLLVPRSSSPLYYDMTLNLVISTPANG